MKRKHWNIVWDAAILVCVFMATVQGNEGAANIVYFFCALCAGGSIGLLCSKDLRRDAAAIERNPEWVSHVFDVTSMILLAWFGWWWCALAFLLSINAAREVFETIAAMDSSNQITATNK